MYLLGEMLIALGMALLGGLIIIALCIAICIVLILIKSLIVALDRIGKKHNNIHKE